MDDKTIVADGLWNENITPKNYSSNDQYYEHLFSQYRLFVDAAQQTGERRATLNSFFLTVHSLLITGLGLAIAYRNIIQIQQTWAIFFPLFAMLILCYVWWRTLKSYRQLSTAKFQIIGEFERRLPSSPFWSAEWKLLGEGKDPKRYTPLTHIEHWIPIIFAVLYIFGVVGFILL